MKISFTIGLKNTDWHYNQGVKKVIFKIHMNTFYKLNSVHCCFMLLYNDFTKWIRY